MPAKPLSETEKAYLAGIVDGEGSICVSQRSPNSAKREVSYQYVSTVRIQMCNEELIRWMHEATGLGKVYAHAPKNPKHNPSWEWALSVKDGAEFLRSIQPYLRLKKRQADLYLEMANLRSKSRAFMQYQPQRQLAISQEMAILNRRGVHDYTGI